MKPRLPDNKAFYIGCAILLLVGVVLSVLPSPQFVELVNPPHLPARVTEGNPLVAHFSCPEVHPKVRLDVRTSAPIQLKYNGGLHSLEGSRVTGGAFSYTSRWTGVDFEYSLVIAPSGREFSLGFVPVSGEAVVRSMDFTTVKYRHITSLSRLSGHALGWLAGIFAGILLLNLFLRNSQRETMEWLWVAFCSAAIAYVEPGFCVSLLLFLAAMFALRRQLAFGDHRSRIFPLLMLLTIAFLIGFKYAKAFFFHALNAPPGFLILMPFGVSYFVIRLLDTQLRWHRKEVLNISFRQFLYFMLFPGTIIAGPIENIVDFFGNRLQRIDKGEAARGLARILIGLFKKIVLVSAILGPALQGLRLGRLLWFNSGGSEDKLLLASGQFGGGEILAFAVAGVLYAYLDFSAYSDIAIGASRLMGHRIRENFHFPIFAPNLRLFWQRWHISLSDWSFRNAYFPLLLKVRNSHFPLYATMLFIGMWHAPSLSWFAWAIHHATGLTVVAILEKRFRPSPLTLRLLYPVRALTTFIFVATGFLFVYFQNFSISLALYTKLWTWLLTLGHA